MRSGTRREIYKGKVVQGCARKTAVGKWQPVISIQLCGGATEFYQSTVQEEFHTLKEANIRSRAIAKRLIDEGSV